MPEKIMRSLIKFPKEKFDDRIGPAISAITLVTLQEQRFLGTFDNLLAVISNDLREEPI